MRTKCIEIIIAIALGVLIPSLLVVLLQDREIQADHPFDAAGTTATEADDDNKITVLMDDNLVECIPLEEYVLSVVLSEMPADFEIEALKSQAVVARTYALRRAVKGWKHTGAIVCTRSSCCQGYISLADYLAKGGKQSNIDKVRKAIDSTAGIVLVYQGQLIDATYFSCSGGLTEDAQAVWGTEVPYLKSVTSPGEEKATHYVDTVQYTSVEFFQKLGLPANNKIKITNIEYTEGGGIATVVINSQPFSGTQLRKLLKLRSTSLYITSVGETVTITTKGYGHRVGMSQYGADAMAVNGASFDQILKHYYSGVELIPFELD